MHNKIHAIYFYFYKPISNRNAKRHKNKLLQCMRVHFYSKDCVLQSITNIQHHRVGKSIIKHAFLASNVMENQSSKEQNDF